MPEASHTVTDAVMHAAKSPNPTADVMRYKYSIESHFVLEELRRLSLHGKTALICISLIFSLSAILDLSLCLCSQKHLKRLKIPVKLVSCLIHPFQLLAQIFTHNATAPKHSATGCNQNKKQCLFF